MKKVNYDFRHSCPMAIEDGSLVDDEHGNFDVEAHFFHSGVKKQLLKKVQVSGYNGNHVHFLVHNEALNGINHPFMMDNMMIIPVLENFIKVVEQIGLGGLLGFGEVIFLWRDINYVKLTLVKLQDFRQRSQNFWGIKNSEIRWKGYPF